MTCPTSVRCMQQARAPCSQPPTLAWSAPSEGNERAPLRAVERKHLYGVTAQHLVDHVVREAGNHLLGVGLAVRPRGVGVRIVGLEADVVRADRLEVGKTVLVRGEAAEDARSVVSRRRVGDGL